MILVVDDDPAMVQSVRDTLEKDGHEVVSASNGREALDIARDRIPSLVLSDISMPELGGLELQQEYRQQFPTRETPFVFLSSIQYVDSMVHGLEAGADDYLAKPINPALLCAKIRAVLRRSKRRVMRSVRGNLADVSFTSVVRSCELKGLTGVLEVQAPDGEVISIRFRAGVLDESDAESAIDKVVGLSSGWFTIRSEAPDFADLETTGSNLRAADEAAELLIGRVSAISLSKRLFQIETESLDHDPACVVTIVTIEGKTVWKRSSRLKPPLNRQAIADRVNSQHEEVEHYVHDKLNAAIGPEPEPEEEAPVPSVQFHRLFDRGYEFYRTGDYRQAIACWETALALDPASAALAVNLRIAKEKLAAKNAGSGSSK